MTCLPGCRDRRPPAPGTPRAVAVALEAAGLTPQQMTGYLASLGVARFGDLCYSHADAIRTGLAKSVLADDVRAFPA